jgi:O-antigen/teichoic acid export membrane protein
MTAGERHGGAPTPPASEPRTDVTPEIPAYAGIGAFGTFSRGLRTRGTHWMLVGAGAAAVGAYLFQLIGARSLGRVGYAPISALWTIQYLIVSVVLYPVETYVAHRTLLGHAAGSAVPTPLARIWGWIAGVAVVVTVLSWTLRRQLFHDLADLALLVGLVTVAFGAFMIVRGRLAGTERFKAYGLVTACESMVRAVLAAGLAWVAATTRALAWVMPFGALGAAGLWLILKRRPREPRAARAAPTAPPRPVRFLVLTTGANGILQLLLAGGPLVLVFLGAPPEEVSILFVTLAAARVPLIFFFSGLLSRLLPTFLHLAGSDEGRALQRTASWIALGTCGVAVLGGAAAAAVGSPLLGLLFGRSFAPEWWVAAGVTVGVLLATGSMVLNQVLIAQGSEDLSLAVWVVALAATAVSVASTGGTLTARVVIAFVVGEAVALLGLLVGASRPSIASRVRIRSRSAGTT